LLAIIEPMMSRELTLEEEKLFDLPVKLVEDFEERHYPMRESSPTEMLKLLMEQI
jgi:HTH-type transcriptional regulator/antitoxin HigA